MTNIYPESHFVHLYLYCVNTIYNNLISVLVMHISIADDIKNKFHAACAIRGLKMSKVISELVEQ